MNIKIKRRYRDNLHGSIDVSEIEDLVISHVYFQRLRRIKQTALLFYVFPGAMHTRFEHSLGTLYLADRGWQKILDNKERFLNSYKPIAKVSKFNVIFNALKNVELLCIYDNLYDWLLFCMMSVIHLYLIVVNGFFLKEKEFYFTIKIYPSI